MTANANNGKSDRSLFLIHLLTAVGAPLALLALIAGANGDLAQMFFWLLVSLFVDGIDGPLARHYDLAKRLPRWSGVILDLVIDYATYVFLPAFALYQSGVLPEWMALAGGCLIVFTGAIYFADGDMKTKTGGFSGFPGVWNMVIAVIIGLQVPVAVSVVLIVGCSILTFVPLEFVHPVRTKMWRPLTLVVLAIWTTGLWISFANDFIISGAVYGVITATSLYLLCVGGVQQLVIWRHENG
ncbi:CDP-alcohol phosphatidyltransferase family protein [Polycladidibacter hongkongensis]|uniref:CDP-alcohol phosphatidyltransferase family protein n=1 Tax=Polycladidibacter hongkongensis TaxID=1647556 RepID=UPI00082DD1F9|nr:CDP-alcohol phosphatidyltransferase family protein [Pseudovibrio hongkongensis]